MSRRAYATRHGAGPLPHELKDACPTRASSTPPTCIIRTKAGQPALRLARPRPARQRRVANDPRRQLRSPVKVSARASPMSPASTSWTANATCRPRTARRRRSTPRIFPALVQKAARRRFPALSARAARGVRQCHGAPDGAGPAFRDAGCKSLKIPRLAPKTFPETPFPSEDMPSSNAQNNRIATGFSRALARRLRVLPSDDLDKLQRPGGLDALNAFVPAKPPATKFMRTSPTARARARKWTFTCPMDWQSARRLHGVVSSTAGRWQGGDRGLYRFAVQEPSPRKRCVTAVADYRLYPAGRNIPPSSRTARKPSCSCTTMRAITAATRTACSWPAIRRAPITRSCSRSIPSSSKAAGGKPAWVHAAIGIAEIALRLPALHRRRRDRTFSAPRKNKAATQPINYVRPGLPPLFLAHGLNDDEGQAQEHDQHGAQAARSRRSGHGCALS